MADKEVRVKIIGDTSDLKNKLNALKKDLKDLASSSNKSNNNMFDKMSKDVDEFKQDVKEADKVMDNFNSSLNKSNKNNNFDKLTKSVDKLKANMTKLGTALKNAFSNLGKNLNISGITDKFTKIKNAMKELGSNTLGKVASKLKEMFSSGREGSSIFTKLRDIIGSITGKVSNFGGKVKGAFSGVKAKITDIITSLSTLVTGIANSGKAFTTTKNKMEQLKKKMQENGKAIQDLLNQNRNLEKSQMDVARSGKATDEELDLIRLQMNANEQEARDLMEDNKKLGKSYNELKEQTKDAGNSFDNFKSKISSLKDAFSKLKSGDFAGAFKSLKGACSGANGGLIALIGTVTAVCTALLKLQQIGKQSFFEGLSSMKQTLQPIINFSKRIGSELKNAFENLTGSQLNLTGLITDTVQFDYAIARAGATCRATGSELKLLEDTARRLGQETKFSATEVADAFYYMSLAGWDVSSMLDGIDEVLTLANVSGMDLADTCDIVTDYLSAFGLSSKDASDFCNHLAVTSTATNTTIAQLAEAYKNCASVASEFGVSQMFLNTQLGVLANAGNKGSSAGTVLKNMYNNLLNPANDEAGALYEKWGINVNGELNPALTKTNQITGEQILNEQALNDKLREQYKSYTKISDKAKFLKTIFGSRGMAGGATLMGASDFDYTQIEMAQKTSDSFGSYLNSQYKVVNEQGKLIDSNGKVITSMEGIDKSTQKNIDAVNGMYDVYQQVVDSQIADVLNTTNKDLGAIIISLGEDGKVSAENIGDFCDVISSIQNPSDQARKALEGTKEGVKGFQDALVYSKDGTLDLTKSIDNLVPILSQMDEKSRNALLTQMGLGDSIDEVNEIVNNSNKAWNDYKKKIGDATTATEQMEKYFEGTFLDNLKVLNSAIREVFNSLLLPFKDNITAGLKSVSTFFGHLANIIKKNGKSTYKDLTDISKGWGKAIESGLSNAIKGLGSFVNGEGFDTLLTVAGDIVDGFCKGINNNEKGIQEALSGMIRKSCEWITTHGGEIKQVIITIGNALRNAIDENEDVIKDALDTIVDIVEEWMKFDAEFNVEDGTIWDKFMSDFMDLAVEKAKLWGEKKISEIWNGLFDFGNLKDPNSGGAFFSTNPIDLIFGKDWNPFQDMEDWLKKKSANFHPIQWIRDKIFGKDYKASGKKLTGEDILGGTLPSFQDVKDWIVQKVSTWHPIQWIKDYLFGESYAESKGGSSNNNLKPENIFGEWHPVEDFKKWAEQKIGTWHPIQWLKERLFKGGTTSKSQDSGNSAIKPEDLIKIPSMGDVKAWIEKQVSTWHPIQWIKEHLFSNKGGSNSSNKSSDKIKPESLINLPTAEDIEAWIQEKIGSWHPIQWIKEHLFSDKGGGKAQDSGNDPLKPENIFGDWNPVEEISQWLDEKIGDWTIVKWFKDKFNKDEKVNVKDLMSIDTKDLDDLKAKLEEVNTTANNTASNLSTAFSSIQDSARVAFTGVRNICYNQMTNVANIIKNQAKNGRDGFTQQMMSMAKVASTQLNGVRTAVVSKFISINNVITTQCTNARNNFTRQFMSMSRVASAQLTNVRTAVVSKMMSIARVVGTQAKSARDNLTRQFMSMDRVVATQMAKCLSTVQSYMAQIKSATNQQMTMKFKVEKTITTTNVTKNVEKGMKTTMSSMNSNMMGVGSPNIMSAGGLGTININANTSGGISGNLALEVPLYLDGKEIARASAVYTEAELAKLKKRNNRKRGK